MVDCAGTASNISVEMIGANAVGLGFVDGVPAVDIHIMWWRAFVWILTEEVVVAPGVGKQEKAVGAFDRCLQFLGPCGGSVPACPVEFASLVFC